MKKFLGMIVMAVIAIAMVSCNKVSVEDEINAALKTNDLGRLVAIGDSVKALDNQADGTTQAEGVKSYASAWILICKVQDKQIAESELKGYEAFKDVDTFVNFCDNFQALYDASNAKDAKAAQVVYDTIMKNGGVSVQDMLAKAKQERDMATQIKLQDAAISEVGE